MDKRRARRKCGQTKQLDEVLRAVPALNPEEEAGLTATSAPVPAIDFNPTPASSSAPNNPLGFHLPSHSPPGSPCTSSPRRDASTPRACRPPLHARTSASGRPTGTALCPHHSVFIAASPYPSPQNTSSVILLYLTGLNRKSLFCFIWKPRGLSEPGPNHAEIRTPETSRELGRCCGGHGEASPGPAQASGSRQRRGILSGAPLT